MKSKDFMELQLNDPFWSSSEQKKEGEGGVVEEGEEWAGIYISRISRLGKIISSSSLEESVASGSVHITRIFLFHIVNGFFLFENGDFISASDSESDDEEEEEDRHCGIEGLQ